MNLEQLKAEFPALYRACVELGRKQEHDRVASHIVMGRRVDDLRLAISSIRNGAAITDVMPHYLAAGRNRRDIQARLEDDDVVRAATDGIVRTPSGHRDQYADAVVDEFMKLIGETEDRAIEDLQ